MEKKKIQKKLVLNRNTIVSFDNDSLRRIVGGVFYPETNIIYPCDTNATCVVSGCGTCGTVCSCLSACC
jgi:hypothetical protein